MNISYLVPKIGNVLEKWGYKKCFKNLNVRNAKRAWKIRKINRKSSHAARTVAGKMAYQIGIAIFACLIDEYQ
jgi:hypothetical protein